MAFFKLTSLAVVALATSAIFSAMAGAVRQFEKRSDLETVPPISDSGYTVPLEGGWTCHNSSNCTDKLPGPPINKVLTVLTIARGNFSYSCTLDSPGSAPVYLSQQTALYDVTPLIQYFPTEATLHTLVPKLYSYDYAELTNSSLICNGEIYTQLGTTTVELTGYNSFVVQVNATIPAPDAQVNTGWVQYLSKDYDWEVFRVETAGGVVPTNCVGLGEQFEITYAAEYWFYHS